MEKDPQQHNQKDQTPVSCCPTNTPSKKKKFDYILWGSLAGCVLAFILTQLSLGESLKPIAHLSVNITMLVMKMWWGIVLGVVFVGLLSQVPREFVMKILGNQRGLKSILRATLAGLLLDLCNHGILLVAMKLYERGASTAQTMAFLIASPWNSFSLTLILWSLIGLPWTIVFVLCSGAIAIISGLIIERMETKGYIVSNPNTTTLPDNFHFFAEAKKSLLSTTWNFFLLKKITVDGLKDSRMILRWILFGSILSGLIQTFVPTEHLQHYFGATLAGLGFTLLAATLIEVCSEGSTPIAADLFNRALAPGNAFAFLMAGAATDYTEIIALRQQTKSWKIAFLLPLVTLPQVIIISIILNQ